MAIDVLITPASGTVYISGSEAQTPTPPNLTNGSNYLWASGSNLLWGSNEVYTNAPGSSEITGGGAADQVAYFSAASNITGTTGLQYDGTDLTITRTADNTSRGISIQDNEGTETIRLGTSTSDHGLFYLRGATGGNAIYLDGGAGTNYLNAGNVGIGNTTAIASAKLTVRDTSDPQLTLAYDGTYYTTLKTDSAGDFHVNLTSGGTFNFGQSLGNEYFKFLRGNGDGIMSLRDSGHVYFDGGNVIFETASQNYFQIKGTNTLGFGSGADFSMSASGNVFYMTSGTSHPSATPILGIKQNGNVGIGTAAPGFPLSVSGTQYDMAKIASSHSAGSCLYLDADATGGSNWHLQSTADGAGSGGGKLDFVEAGTSRMIIAGGGNVGIGTVGPDVKLDVRGDTNVSGTLGVTSNVDVGNRVRFATSTNYMLDFSNTSTGLTMAGYPNFRQAYSGNAAGNGDSLGSRSYPWNELHVDAIIMNETSGSYEAQYKSYIEVSGNRNVSPGANRVWNSGSNLYWGTSKLNAQGGGGTPGGSDTQVQFNNGGAFGGSANFTWDDTKVDIAQTADDSALEIAGYDDKSGVTAKMHVASNGMAQFVGSSHTQVKATTDSVYITAAEHLYLDNGVRNTYSTIFRDDTGEYARFKNASLGLGTTIPSKKLDVVGQMSLNDANNNVVIGTGAAASATDLNSSVIIGKNAVGNAVATADAGVFVGYNTGFNITSGVENVVLGAFAGDNSNYSKSVLIGHKAGEANTASYSVVVGWEAAPKLTSGERNVALGATALGNLTTGGHNVALGYNALYDNVLRNYNTGVGNYALANTTSGSNTALGYEAGYNNTSGRGNLFLGFQAGPSSTNTDNSKLYIASGAGTPLIGGDFSTPSVTINGALYMGQTITDGSAGDKIYFNGTSHYIHQTSSDLKLYSADDVNITAADDVVSRSNTWGFEDTSAARVMTVDCANARVGIGTSSPTTKLDVRGTTLLSGTTTVTGDLGVSSTLAVTGSTLAVQKAIKNDIAADTTLSDSYSHYLATADNQGAAATVTLTTPASPSLGDEYFIIARCVYAAAAPGSALLRITPNTGQTINAEVPVGSYIALNSLSSGAGAAGGPLFTYKTAHLVCVEADVWSLTLSDVGPTS